LLESCSSIISPYSNNFIPILNLNREQINFNQLETRIKDVTACSSDDTK